MYWNRSRRASAAVCRQGSVLDSADVRHLLDAAEAVPITVLIATCRDP